MAPEEIRRIRVFVSSTFRDMQEERDELAKWIFPQLRKLCEEREIEWGEVDLRWGITEAQSQRGETLPICLAEIERCRPYFIGILGERYGWVPDQISKDLRDQQPWLDEHRESSVTALEILHGVLNNPAMADRSFFYFRDSNSLSKVPEQKRSDFLELPSEEELAKYPPEEAARRAEVRRGKLENLKDRIRKSGLPVRENYRDPLEFGTLVFRDLKAVIDQFPPPIQLDALGREAAAHEVFAKSRFGVYLERQDYFDRLDAHVNGDRLPLVILGESGSGKSALLAHWVERYRERMTAVPPHDQQPLVLIHFIGATIESTDYAAMLRRIIGEFKQHFGIEQEIPEKPDELRSAFANWLHMAAARGKVILVIDALNQLEDRDGAPDLVWLPPVIPPNIRLIVSTLPGRSLNNLKERGWPTLNVEPLTRKERRKLIHSYLAQYRRTPSDNLVERITNASQTENPLYLRSLLEELRLYGDHDTLVAETERYLAAEKTDDLFEMILARWERDYNRNRPELVQDVMTFLWAARRGLTEPELLELLRDVGNPLPAAFWSPFSLAADKALVNRSGLFSFSHDYLRKAVEDRYLSSDNERKRAHLRIAEYFNKKESSIRVLEELPWQYDRAEEWDPLHELLKNLSSFQAIWSMNEFDVKAYWADLETTASYSMTETYQCVLTHPEKYHDSIWGLARLFHETGNLKEGDTLWQFLTRSYRELGDKFGLQASLNNQAVILRDWGQLKEAMDLLKEQERICRILGDKAGLSKSLGNQAQILYTWGQLKEAMDLYKDQEWFCRELGDKAGLSGSLNAQALILRDWGQLKEAMDLLKEQERICRELGDKAGLSGSLNNQALILKDWGQLKEAMDLLKEEERLCRELGNKAGLSASLGNQAVLLKNWGQLKEAMDLNKEVERICRELGDKAWLSKSLGNQALILLAWGQLKEAMDLNKEVERICRELGYKAGLSGSLDNQAQILYTWGQLKEAMDLLKEDEQICRELGDKAGLQASLNNQALILMDWGQLKEAMDLHKEEEQLCRELGDKAGLSASLGNQALILLAWGQLKEAMDLLKEQERICRELKNMDGLVISLANQALMYQEQQESDKAFELMSAAFSISHAHGYGVLEEKIRSLLEQMKQARDK